MVVRLHARLSSRLDLWSQFAPISMFDAELLRSATALDPRE
jgi:hypothetical protein